MPFGRPLSTARDYRWRHSLPQRCRPPSVGADVSDASAVCAHRCRAWSHLAQQVLHPAQPQTRSTCRPEYAAGCPRYAPG